MENASKALLMAGGILIAILTIGLVAYLLNSSGQLLQGEENTDLAEQIEAFNKEYEAYNRKLMRGTDIISIINKVNSNNKKYEDIPEYQMTVDFTLIEDLGYTKKEKKVEGKTVVVVEMGDKTIPKGTYNNNDSKWNEIKNNVEAFTDFKRRVFDCTNMEFNKQTGRVYKMSFKERKIEYTEGL